MHSYLTWRTQPTIYSDYSLFVAEVASNFNQAMVRAHLFETQPDRDFQIALIEEAMSNFHRYFFIMPTLARFELALHERVEAGKSMSADEMGELLADLFAEGYGDELTMDRERTGITWAQFSSHLYANFYVYQYATGISGAHALANRVLGRRAGRSRALPGLPACRRLTLSAGRAPRSRRRSDIAGARRRDLRRPGQLGRPPRSSHQLDSLDSNLFSSSIDVSFIE